METVVLAGHLQNLVHEFDFAHEFVQDLPEEFALRVEVRAGRPIEADEPGVKSDPGILPFRAGPFRRASKINGILGDKGPIPLR